jgi:hypothetical protein
MDAIETTPMKSILQRGIGGITIPTTRLSLDYSKRCDDYDPK